MTIRPGRGLISLSNQSFAFTGGRQTRDPRPPHGDDPWYSDPVTVRKVDENSTAETATNSSTENTISSLTLPALILSSTGAARLSATGTVNKNSGGSETVTFRLKAADDSSTSTVLATTTINLGNSTDPHAWMLEALFLGKQPDVNRGWGMIDIAGAGAGGTLTPSTFSAVGFSTMGLDEGEQWTISITAQMSAASTNFSVTRQVSILEGVN